MIVSTHDKQIMEIADRTLVMSNGRIILDE